MLQWIWFTQKCPEGIIFSTASKTEYIHCKSGFWHVAMCKLERINYPWERHIKFNYLRGMCVCDNTVRAIQTKILEPCQRYPKIASGCTEKQWLTSLLPRIVIASSPSSCSFPSWYEFNTRLDSIAIRFNYATYSLVHSSGRWTLLATVFIKCLIFIRVRKITAKSDY